MIQSFFRVALQAQFPMFIVLSRLNEIAMSANFYVDFE
jgi:hypothetical protein